MLNQVADGVWVRQSEWVWSNAVVVRGDGGLILVDPGIDGSDLNQLADDVDRLGIPVFAGFSTHPHVHERGQAEQTSWDTRRPGRHTISGRDCRRGWPSGPGRDKRDGGSGSASVPFSL